MADSTDHVVRLRTVAIGGSPCNRCCREALRITGGAILEAGTALLDAASGQGNNLVLAFVPGVRPIPREIWNPPKPIVEPPPRWFVTPIAQALQLGLVVVAGIELIAGLRERLALAQAANLILTLGSTVLDAANPTLDPRRRIFSCEDCILSRAWQQRREKRVWAESESGVRVYTRKTK